MFAPKFSGRDFISDPGWGANNSSASGTYNGVIDTLFGGAPTQAQPTGVFPHATIIEVLSSGRVQEVHGVGYFYNYNWGPAGWTPPGAGRSAAMGLVMTSPLGGSTWWVSPNSTDSATTIDTIRIDGGNSIYGQRGDAIPNVEPGDASHCGPHGYAPCRTWTGTASLSFTRLHADLTLSPAALPEVTPDTLVTFTVGATPGTIKGYTVDLSEIRWRWQPANSGGDTVTCESTSGTTCTHRMRGPGRMLVTAYVNGEQQQRATGGLEIHAVDSLGVQLAGSPLPTPCADDSILRRDHPELANRVMDSVLKVLWRKAKYSADTLSLARREVGGWILRINDTTYGFAPFPPDSPSGPCYVDGGDNPPANAFWEIHVHPFANGDSQYACQSKRYMTDTVKKVYGHHRTGVSGRVTPAGYVPPDTSDDYGSLAHLTVKLGREFKGIVIDADSIVTYQLSDLNETGYPRRDANFKLAGGRYRRCSY